MTIRQLFERYGDMSFFSLRNIILSNSAESEDAAFYLIRYAMEEEFALLYHQFNLRDELGDVLMDFQLYLRDGKTGNNVKPYKGIEGLESMIFFKRWVKRAFKNFLIDRSYNETRAKREYREYAMTAMEKERMQNDNQIHLACTAIAWMMQDGKPDELFLFYRHLLHTMCKVDVIPSERMCKALGITHNNYRTRDSRINAKFLGMIGRLNSKQKAPLTDASLKMANDLYEQFDDITDIIKKAYEVNLQKMDAQIRIQEERDQDLAEQKWNIEQERIAQEKKLEEERKAEAEKKNSNKTKSETKAKTTSETKAKADDDTSTRYSLRSEGRPVRFSIGGPQTRYSLKTMPSREQEIARLMEEYYTFGTMRGQKVTESAKPTKPIFHRWRAPIERAQYKKVIHQTSLEDTAQKDYSDLNPRKDALKLLREAFA